MRKRFQLEPIDTLNELVITSSTVPSVDKMADEPCTSKDDDILEAIFNPSAPIYASAQVPKQPKVSFCFLNRQKCAKAQQFVYSC